MAHRNGDGSTRALAQGLGWFSVGLGVTKLLAGRQLARWLGMEEHTTLIRAFGARELAAGVGILTAEDPTGWMWGRVGGDALDLATLASGLGEGNPQRANVGIALAAVAGVTVLDVVCARQLSTAAPPPRLRDYSGRRGMPRPPEAMRGAAGDLEVPRDFRIPEPLRPYATSAG